MNATSYFATADTWTGEIVEALSQMHGRVLDVGCGAGRHALHAASLGCDVVGLEPSPGAIEVCRRRRVHAIRGRLGDQDISLDGFDGVMMLGNNLGLLASPQEAPGHLRWLADRCPPGATLVGEALDPTDTVDPDHLAYQRRATAAGRAAGQMRLRASFNGQVDDWFSYWHLTPDELRHAVSQTPWRVVGVAGSPTYVAVLTRE
ncbi:MAG: class I SAM-dependent methyltransferase [Actinomycetota bacterium]|nr:class I SAM-dependent methyltransferase [Actinomycetota bacterium]